MPPALSETPATDLASSPEKLLVSVRDLGVKRDGRWLVRGVDLDVRAGEIVTLIGPNGSGKSTTTRCILGLISPSTGHITRRPGLRIGYVPQRTSVDWDFPVTALDVVCMGLYGKIGWFRRVKRSHRDAARQALCSSIDSQW